MSIVPPSPPWPITRMSVPALHLQGGRDPGGHRRRVAEQRVQPRQLPRRLGVRRREHLEAAGRVGRDQLAARRAHRGVERVARAEHLAAALAGAVAGGDRVRALARRTAPSAASGSSSRLPAAKRPGLVELDLLLRQARSSDAPEATVPRSRRMFSACGPGAGAALVRASSRSTSARSRSRKCSRRLEPVADDIANSAVQRALRDRAAAEPRDDVVDRSVDAARAACSARGSRRGRPRTPSRPRRPCGLRRARRAARRAGTAGST